MTEKCTKCKTIKNIDSFSKEKKKNGIVYYRKICKQCRNKQKRDSNAKSGYYKKTYLSMSKEDRKEYINKKSKQNQKRFLENPEARLKRKNYSLSDKGIYSRYKADCNRRGRLNRGILMLLDFKQFQLLINGNCYYCNKLNCRGIDRVDSTKSYSMDNTKPCCSICNQMKNSLSEDEFIYHITAILDNIAR